MNITELIEDLVTLRQENGNIEVLNQDHEPANIQVVHDHDDDGATVLVIE